MVERCGRIVVDLPRRYFEGDVDQNVLQRARDQAVGPPSPPATPPRPPTSCGGVWGGNQDFLMLAGACSNEPANTLPTERRRPMRYLARKLPLSIAITTLALFTTTVTDAQIPESFSYQGVALGTDGELLPDGGHNVAVALYTNSDGGSPIHSENQNVIVTDGLFSMIIGVTGFADSVDFSQQYWLGVKIDNGEELVPRTPIVPVPYAIYSATASNADRSNHSVFSDAAKYADSSGLSGRASVATLADGLSPGATGFIKSIAGESGVINVANPAGPTAALSIPNGGLNLGKISTLGSTEDQAIVSNGSSLEWRDLPDEFQLPYAGSYDQDTTAFSVSTSSQKPAIEAITDDNQGVALKATFSPGGQVGTALELDNGFVKVSGSHSSFFVHTTTNTNVTTNLTRIGYESAKESDIVFAQYTGSSALGKTYRVQWGRPNWVIVLDDAQASMPVGIKFHVIVIRQ